MAFVLKWSLCARLEAVIGSWWPSWRDDASLLRFEKSVDWILLGVTILVILFQVPCTLWTVSMSFKQNWPFYMA